MCRWSQRDEGARWSHKGDDGPTWSRKPEAETELETGRPEVDLCSRVELT